MNQWMIDQLVEDEQGGEWMDGNRYVVEQVNWTGWLGVGIEVWSRDRGVGGWTDAWMGDWVDG